MSHGPKILFHFHRLTFSFAFSSTFSFVSWVWNEQVSESILFENRQRNFFHYPITLITFKQEEEGHDVHIQSPKYKKEKWWRAVCSPLPQHLPNDDDQEHTKTIHVSRFTKKTTKLFDSDCDIAIFFPSFPISFQFWVLSFEFWVLNLEFEFSRFSFTFFLSVVFFFFFFFKFDCVSIYTFEKEKKRRRGNKTSWVVSSPRKDYISRRHTREKKKKKRWWKFHVISKI